MKSAEPFSDFVNNQRGQALVSMLSKARQSNHIAKLTAGADRQRAYQLKYRILSDAITFDPANFVVDLVTPKTGLVGIEGPAGFRFHAPIPLLSPAAREVLAAQIISLFN